MPSTVQGEGGLDDMYSVLVYNAHLGISITYQKSHISLVPKDLEELLEESCHLFKLVDVIALTTDTPTK